MPITQHHWPPKWTTLRLTCIPIRRVFTLSKPSRQATRHIIGIPIRDRNDSSSKLDILVDNSRTAIIIRMKEAAVPNTQQAARTALLAG